ncbi:FAD:protein FMN transferase [uncultured Flavobacterium sp.]|uniref:FAD:protein FMN transferase n=1 Tax=uncultured Flavobacterium sp. TaxID=165435 RepID=UPI0030EDAC30|tara:strand:- start:143752 stop:144744 length:993 start_codon:yes stop_codon:yes gene_type:complete
MIRNLSLIWFIFTAVVVTGQVTQKRTLSMLGSPFEMIVEAKDIPEADAYIDMAVAEVSRIENLISDWIPTTPISEVNRNAGIKPVKVPQEVFDLVQRSIKISELTSGAFDISYASMDKIWKFDGSMTTMPTPEEIKKSVEKVGYKNIILEAENNTIFLKKEGMKLGLGGIGQGFIADKIKALLISKGVIAGIVNISGDINTWGKQLNGEKWKVGIKNPLNKDKIFATFPLEDSAVETSGSYEKYVTFNGIRYSHIIDTRTGYPASGVISVSVFAKSTEFADALATGVFVMGVDVGLDLVNQLPGIGCIYVDDKGKIFASKNIDLKKFNNE